MDSGGSAALAPSARAVHRRDVLGVPLAAIDYEGAMDAMDAIIAARERGYLCATPTHGIMVSRDDAEMHAAMTGATLNVPDGMPLVWLMNALGEQLEDRVYGPDLMAHYSDRCAAAGHRVWLYGGRDDAALAQLEEALRRKHPGIEIVGGHSPPFRPLTAAEEEKLCDQINADRPDVLWVGIGVPKQEKWMARMRERLEVPMMCGVGAAFDFHAGRVPQAPGWMQQRGLEWLYRLAQDPRRLLPRYLYYNPRFVVAAFVQLLRERGRRGRSLARRRDGRS